MAGTTEATMAAASPEQLKALMHYNQRMLGSLEASGGERVTFKEAAQEATTAGLGADSAELVQDLTKKAETVELLDVQQFAAHLSQNVLCDVRREEAARRWETKQLKHARRAEFDIGWRAEGIPSNATTAEKLGCVVAPQGMCCLAVDEDAVRVAPTIEPACAVNLEYVSLALKIRRTEGREPLFSLEPIESTREDEAAMQMKRFEPEWLAGTSVGEVMFQADYHLKELSMGEHNQPIIGMKSCFDYSAMEGVDQGWNAREWFVVRKAEIQLSEDNVLIPCLKMGVEAREQIFGGAGLEDAALTRPDHPLVKYAETFTRNFDLIAERKSVVSQLREVAKASVLAKFLVESGINMEESWFSSAAEADPAYCLEVPQLWNEQRRAKFSVEDGVIMEEETGKGANMCGVYGGVDFGIDRFRLAAPSRVATSVVAGRAALGRPSSTLMATTQQRLTMGRVSAPMAMGRVSAPLAMGRVSAPMAMGRVSAPMAMRRVSAPMAMGRVSAPLGMSVAASRAGLAAPKGVDLNLDQHNLSATTEVAGAMIQPADANVTMGSVFWSGLRDGASTLFRAEDKAFFQSVFNPHLSDRHTEGDNFAPPPTDAAYMQKLKALVKSERSMQEQRKHHFFSQGFNADKPGSLFPASWTSSVELARMEPKSVHTRTARPEYKDQPLLRDALKGAEPSFDKATEDGTQYRIYLAGFVEVRTTQEHDGVETVGAVFTAQ